AHLRGADVADCEAGEDAGVEPWSGARRLRRRSRRGPGGCGGPGDDDARHRLTRGGEAEHGLVCRDVGLGALDGDADVPRAPLRADLVGEGKPDAVDLLVAAEVEFLDLLGAADPPCCDLADLEVIVGIEVELLDVSVLEGHTEAVRRRAVHVLRTEILDPMPLLPPADEGALEVGGLRHDLRVVGGGALSVPLPLERVESPALAAVPGLDLRETLEGRLGADQAGPLREQPPGGLDAEVASAEVDLAGQAEGLDRGDP